MSLLLGKSAEFVLGHLIGGVVFVPRLPPGGGSPGVHVDCRVASGCFDIHLRVDCVLGIWTVISTSPWLVLFQEAKTSCSWMAGGVVKLLQFLYVFPWAMLQNILN